MIIASAFLHSTKDGQVMKILKQLTERQRYQIAALKKAGKTNKEIAIYQQRITDLTKIIVMLEKNQPTIVE